MKKQIKKVLVLVCVLAIVLSAYGCAKSPVATKNPTPTASASASPSASDSASPEPTQQGTLTITPSPVQAGDATESIGNFSYWAPSDMKKMTEEDSNYYYEANGNFFFTSVSTYAAGIDSNFMKGYRMGITSYKTERITYENQIAINDMDVYQYVYTADIDATTTAYAFTYAMATDTELLSITYVSIEPITNDQYGILDAVAKSVKFNG